MPALALLYAGLDCVVVCRNDCSRNLLFGLTLLSGLIQNFAQQFVTQLSLLTKCICYHFEMNAWGTGRLATAAVQALQQFLEAARLRKVSRLEIRGKMRAMWHQSALDGSIQHGKFAFKATWKLGMTE
ncbi:uncharacterized protein [Triticum aestivum]|uniref:uncharacterized protein n=1 Tax=Triticum aestivum TaxID=4565 RepID=UPI001D008D6B|nr:uncharacterized protein LOC123107691 [Triticum aestivum]